MEFTGNISLLVEGENNLINFAKPLKIEANKVGLEVNEEQLKYPNVGRHINNMINYFKIVEMLSLKE